MELNDWLDAERGRSVALAKALGKHKTAVTLWRTAGVPMVLMPQVSAFTKGKVKVEDLMRHALRCRIENAKPAATTEG